MLFGKKRSVSRRVALVLVSLTTVTLGGVLLAAAGAFAGLWHWPPQPSSTLGVSCGIAAGAIVFFEMALLAKKWLRGLRLGATRVWMWWHIWLGLVCLPIVLIHGGFGLGGWLSGVTMVLFLLVTFSGVWGLVMQQWLPEKMRAELTGESVASQIDFLGDSLAVRAAQIFDGLISTPPESVHAQPIVMGEPRDVLVLFRDKVLLPYLRLGKRTGSTLVARAEAVTTFARLREVVPTEAHPALGELAELADQRRQWDVQSRLNFWLHNWLLVHLPLSVAMTGLMVLHAIRALKYW